MPLLDVRGLRKRYGTRTVVKGISIQVEPGEIVGLLGPNGAGKTTAFKMVVGLVDPTGGEIEYRGEPIRHEPMFQRARRGIAYLPQEPSIFGRLKVRENLEGVLELLGMSFARRRRLSDRLLEELGLSTLAEQLANTLSGGERRRLEIARALLVDPQLMLLDEPFSAIDPKAVHDIQEIIKTLRSRGIGILLTDHAVRETLSVTDRAYLIHEGEIQVHGQPETILANPIARKHYLGERFKM